MKQMKKTTISYVYFQIIRKRSCLIYAKKIVHVYPPSLLLCLGGIHLFFATGTEAIFYFPGKRFITDWDTSQYGYWCDECTCWHAQYHDVYLLEIDIIFFSWIRWVPFFKPWGKEKTKFYAVFNATITHFNNYYQITLEDKIIRVW